MTVFDAMAESTFLHHEPCPSCGSKDNLARYSDGHGYCFGCGFYTASPENYMSLERKEKNLGGLIHGEYRPLLKRKITEETCRKFGYQVGLFHGKPVHIAPYYNLNGELVAQKVRFPNKDFIILGNMKEAGLFGAHLWGNGKKIIITEGEIDCLSASQVQDNKWPVVSVPNGAHGAKKTLAKSLDYLLGFEEIILMFDMDESGRKAAQECAALFPPGRCKIATLPAKDANELLQQGKGEEIIRAIWQAKPYRPDGIIKFSDIRETIRKPVEWGLPWCFPTLTKLTYGRRLGECVALGAGTGIGKTDLITQQAVFDVVELGEKVGLFFLEQQPEETGLRLAGKLAGKRFHVPDGGWTTEELDAAVERLSRYDRVFFYDHYGVADWEIIAQHIRYLKQAEGVRLFYLDHLTALASGAGEKEQLEKIMGEIGGLVKELDIWLLFVSHLSTPEGKPHEEGGRVMIRHFKGSRSIGFWSHFMIGLERDQQNENINTRQSTIVRLLKDRYTGQSTGQVFWLGYDVDTGRLYETEEPDKQALFMDETDDGFAEDELDEYDYGVGGTDGGASDEYPSGEDDPEEF